MNTIEFRVVPTSLDYGPGIEIRIDDQCLVGMVRRVELPFTEAEGHPRTFGGYDGPTARV
jgi:hypothetical protein